MVRVDRTGGVSLVVGACVLLTVDIVLAAEADSNHFGTSGWLIGADLVTGAAFVVAAWCAPGPVAQRILVGLVGSGWWVGSWVPLASSVHQGLLLVALLAFPVGRIHGPWRWLVAALAVPVVLGVDEQIVVAGTFALAALVILIDRRSQLSSRSVRWYAGLSAGACAVTLAVAWTLAGGSLYDPTVALVIWQAVLIVIAIGFVRAASGAIVERVQRAENAVDSGPDGDLSTLAAMLGCAIGDPDLRVYRWSPESAWFVDDAGRQMRPPMLGKRQLVVENDSGRVGVVIHTADTLRDTRTAQAVAEAVGLTVSSWKLRDELADRVADLEASRERLLTADDRVRQQVGVDVRQSIHPALDSLRQELSRALVDALVGEAVQGNEAAAIPLRAAFDEVTLLAQELRDMLRGIPPVDLGGGKLRPVLTSMFSGIPLINSVDIPADAAWDERVESVLFYVCAEALTNAIKHSGAAHIDLVVRERGDRVELRVADDGCGGADPNGSGLRGLADRLATTGGRLRVDSQPGHGTVVRVDVDLVS